MLYPTFVNLLNVNDIIYYILYIVSYSICEPSPCRQRPSEYVMYNWPDVVYFINP